MQNKTVKVCAKGKSLARKVCVACSILVATLVLGNLVRVDKVQAGGMSAPGFTPGIPVYADLPVGFYYVNQHLSAYRDPQNMDIRSNANVFFMYYQSPWELAGGPLSFVVAPTLFEVSSNPGPYRIGMYNTYFGAQISWATGIEGLRFGYRFSGYIPQDGEVAFDYGAIENRFGLSYDHNGISVLVNNIFGTPVGAGWADHAPDYYILDWHLLKSFGKWSVGPVGYASSDLDSAGRGFKQSQVAVGGLVGYNFGPLTLQGKLTQDVYEENYGAKETAFWTNIIIPIGVK
ncbi:transporter [Methyloceanibacter sp.]|uniref:transporter n=1 Tax=Methyloceanibacter sp. TaxID=1965321 RepID=UPI0020811C0A|nr:transporter [Methyloceanibacter sp.]GFO81602.1 MAG: hypothetical protein A49_12290 [Methyloceanibacter sp.]HML93107.1 transporter [Methyloceanibacter sp.]